VIGYDQISNLGAKQQKQEIRATRIEALNFDLAHRAWQKIRAGFGPTP